jgi:hypothetical protein
MEEMQAYYKPGCLWHWKRGKPLKEGGPYRLLFAWEGKIFGEATAKITHDIDPGDRGEYDFAFKLQDYTDRKSVALEDLPLTLKQLKHHRDLIKLDEQILKKYDALIGSPSALELVRHYTFILDQDYSRSQIREQVGGNPEPYLPTVDGRVVCACLKTKLNGRAPEVILVGRGPGVERAGDILSQQATPIPVFIKRGPNRWTYRGMWRKKGSSQLPQDIEREADARQGTISRVIYMEPLNLPNES